MASIRRSQCPGTLERRKVTTGENIWIPPNLAPNISTWEFLELSKVV